jgi:hypothetical protein
MNHCHGCLGYHLRRREVGTTALYCCHYFNTMGSLVFNPDSQGTSVADSFYGSDSADRAGKACTHICIHTCYYSLWRKLQEINGDQVCDWN